MENLVIFIDSFHWIIVGILMSVVIGLIYVKANQEYQTIGAGLEWVRASSILPREYTAVLGCDGVGKIPYTCWHFGGRWWVVRAPGGLDITYTAPRYWRPIPELVLPKGEAS